MSSLKLERQGSVVDSLVAKVEKMDQLLAQLEQLSNLVAEVERDTAVRFEQAESLVNHVDELARRGQAELEGQLKQLTDTMEVQLHERLSEFEDTSLEVAELGVELKRRGRELTEFIELTAPFRSSQSASRTWSSGVTSCRSTSMSVSTASQTLNSGVQSSLRACEVQPPGQGGIKILVAVCSPCEHAA